MRDTAGRVLTLGLWLALCATAAPGGAAGCSMFRGGGSAGYWGVPGGFLCSTFPSGNFFAWNSGYYTDGFFLWNDYFYGFNPYYLAVYYPNPYAPWPSPNPANISPDVSPLTLAYRTRGRLVAYPDGQVVIFYPPPEEYLGLATIILRPRKPHPAAPPTAASGVTLVRRSAPQATAAGASVSIPPQPGGVSVLNAGAAPGVMVGRNAPVLSGNATVVGRMRPPVSRAAPPAGAGRTLIINRPASLPAAAEEKQR